MTMYPGNVHMSEYWLWYKVHILQMLRYISYDSVYRQHSHVRVLVVVQSTHTPGTVVDIK